MWVKFLGQAVITTMGEYEFSGGISPQEPPSKRRGLMRRYRRALKDVGVR
jgi:hypothetical protein